MKIDKSTLSKAKQRRTINMDIKMLQVCMIPLCAAELCAQEEQQRPGLKLATGFLLTKESEDKDIPKERSREKQNQSIAAKFRLHGV